MKKKSLNSLILNKKKISNLSLLNGIVGGSNDEDAVASTSCSVDEVCDPTTDSGGQSCHCSGGQATC